MKPCDIEAISALIDGELPEPDALRLRKHFDECPSCRALYQDLSALHNGFAGLETSPPGTLAPGITYKVSLGEEPPRIRRVIRSLVAVAACLVAVLIIRNLEFSATPAPEHYDGPQEESGGVSETERAVEYDSGAADAVKGSFNQAAPIPTANVPAPAGGIEPAPVAEEAPAVERTPGADSREAVQSEILTGSGRFYAEDEADEDEADEDEADEDEADEDEADEDAADDDEEDEDEEEVP